ncbi:heparanase-like protein 3 isoform X1 [Cynara cardunculus var. scolymus]|uniref:heparanase-like protein 3 isoform X1 n=2 Tax=Cynara cardunculus var. scolymus TaxID=59895 RepID=UPI000D624518|nr:heparanase-like protein 3 isoform X1 [Cynara cardunculus var. scolymus]
MMICKSTNGKRRPKPVVLEMCLLIGIMGLCLLVVMLIIRNLHSHKIRFEKGMVYVNGTTSIGFVDQDFICATLDWWPPQKCDYGTCSWGTASLLNLDLNNKILLNAIEAFSPLKLRLGGTLQDKVMYQMAGNQEPCPQFNGSPKELFGFTQGCLPLSRWDELNIFFQKSKAKVIFGLNALSQRHVSMDGSVVGPWNSSNAEALMKYTVDKGFTIHGWELGNELSGNGIGARIMADQYASDTISLQNLVQNIYKSFEVKPIVLGPGGFFDANWFTEYVMKSNGSLQAITQHIYNLGPGVDNDLVNKILDPSCLDGGSQPLRDLQKILKEFGNSTIAWVGEAGGAYNSGHDRVSNTFIFSFWYLDQLGMASSYDTKTYCRQSLIGGNYGLLNTVTFVPNPDYYSALLWHRLMGRHVLLTSFDGTKKIRSYAHCSKHSDGITLLLINLDSYTTTAIGLSVENVTMITASNQLKQTQRTQSFQSSSNEFTREEYHLTAKDGNLNSQTVLLNGKELSVNSTGIIPSLDPVEVNISNPIIVAPFSIVFVHMPDIHLPACT